MLRIDVERMLHTFRLTAGIPTTAVPLGGLESPITILHATMRQNAAQVLRDAATTYKVDVEAIGLKVKQEFVMKEKPKGPEKLVTKAVSQKAEKPA
jgi:ParB family transcriptional regulator, chromosome partitioning protein